ncbi:helix-turn-helix domain-containing protein [Streptomyces phaeochromogenes]
MTDFAARTRAALADQGISMRQAARALNYDLAYLSRVLNGKQQPSAKLARGLDQLADAGGSLEALAASDRQARRATSSLPPSAPAASTAVDRRTFVGAAAVTLASASGIASPRHVDPALIPYFRQQLEGHYSADMMLGPLALVATVEEQCRLIGQLVDSADGPTRRSMAQVGVSYATFAAWLHLDAGDPFTALQWHDVAQELAHRSHDREAIACALVDRAMARTDQGVGAAVVDLCEGALMDASYLSPEVQVFALQQQAHGASLLGDRGEVDQLLDKAGRLVDRVDVEVWGTACLRTPNYVEVQRATCYGRLGLARDADRLWQQVIPAAPATARRDVGVWSARQASASAALGEPERAVDLARSAVGVVLETGSARALRELGAVDAAMSPWQAEPIGQDLAEVLAPIGEGR